MLCIGFINIKTGMSDRTPYSKKKPKKRCFWANSKNPLYVEYHDREWGRAVHDDQKLFEFIVLETAQAGLSWETILNKREHYRRAFAGFDVRKVARFSEKTIQKLLQDPGIVRNQLKIRSCVTNAQAFLKIQKDFGSFDRFVWGFVNFKTHIRRPRGRQDFLATSETSDLLSKDLKARGFKFVGSKICYAYMQAVGMINEHQRDCYLA